MGRKPKNQLNIKQSNISSRIVTVLVLFILGVAIAEEIHPFQDELTTTIVLLSFFIVINIGLFRYMALHKALQHTHRIKYWKAKQKATLYIFLFLTVIMIGEIFRYGMILAILFLFILLLIGIRSVIICYKDSSMSLPSFPFEKHSKLLQINIEDIDKMDGKEFEVFLAELYDAMGYYTEVTPHTDYGIDVIVIKDKIKVGIQAKCYGEGRTVGVDAVNEVCGGAGYWNVQKKIIITNRFFTKKALISAQHNNIEMIDRDNLKILIKEYQHSREQRRLFNSLIFFNKFKHN
ncbi:MAG TPA: restriction endonuclease [Niallia sp.]|nr:restriction endonuclease [Niallia sp.]HWK23974.1 restriction endonuclease [Ureibacillus sp.]